MSYVFFDTGIEYQATKEHLDWLEQKYGIEIHREKAKVPVPLGNKKYGVPFLNKNVSRYISSLQAHGFKWEDESYTDLIEKYNNCKDALKWWTNERFLEAEHNNMFCISRNSWLKEFLIKNPPPFAISNKCCDGAKKNTAQEYIKTAKLDLFILGVRKAEGGQRQTT